MSGSKKKYRPNNLKLFQQIDDNNIGILNRYYSTYYIQNINYTYHFKSETIYPNLYSLNSLELTDYNIILDLVETLAEFIFISQKIGYVCNEFEILYSVVDDNFYYIDYDECFTSTNTVPHLDLLPTQYHDLFIDTFNSLTSVYNSNKRIRISNFNNIY